MDAGQNIYRKCRDDKKFTRERVEKETGDGKGIPITVDRLERFENGKQVPRPEDILALESVYGDFTLSNYYCTHECEIGKRYVKPVSLKQLSEITLDVLASMNAVYADRDRLVEITVDGKITETEKDDFRKIKENLEKIEIAVSELKMWLRSAGIILDE